MRESTVNYSLFEVSAHKKKRSEAARVEQRAIINQWHMLGIHDRARIHYNAAQEKTDPKCNSREKPTNKTRAL
jgi:hypothetical protein